MRALVLTAVVLICACAPSTRVEAACAVTVPATQPVASIGEVPVSASRFSWFGTTALAVNLPNDGIYRVQVGTTDGRAKVAWWRSGDELIDITAERVDGSAPALHTRAPAEAGGYGQFVPGEIVFSSYGCWRVSGKAASGALTFVLLIRKAVPGEVAP